MKYIDLSVYAGQLPAQPLYTITLPQGPFEEIDYSKLIAFEFPTFVSALRGQAYYLQDGYKSYTPQPGMFVFNPKTDREVYILIFEKNH